MTFNWADYHRLAEQLLNDPCPENLEQATCRCAISRAYYAAFWISRDIAIREGATLEQAAADHRAVKRHFKDHHDNAHYEVSLIFGRLLDDRTAADYKAEPDINRKEATKSVEAAGNLLRIASTLPIIRSKAYPLP